MPARPCRRSQTLFPLVAALAAAITACDDDSTAPDLSAMFRSTNLVADADGNGAAQIDPHLANPWGLAINPTNGFIWVANNHTGTSTVYDPGGAIVPLVVDIPTAGGPTGGEPTGIVFNSTSGFVIPGFDAASFILAGEDGTISAWSAAAGAAKIVVDRSADAAYFGIAIIGNTLFAANFKGKVVDVFDQDFALVKSVTDPDIPPEYGPFNVQAIGDQLYVAYAERDPASGDEVAGEGKGYISVFDASGEFVKRFASNGTLNAPWAVVRAPSTFGSYAGAILVGNFGDGRINVFDGSSGDFVAQLLDPDGKEIELDGLWGLAVGPNDELYFAAGIEDEEHGLFGTIGPK